MTHREGIGDKLRRAIQRLGAEATRATGLAQMKMKLNHLQAELKEREGALGRKMAQLKRRGAVKDKFILEALKEEFENLADCEKRVESVLSEMHDLVVPGRLEKETTTSGTKGREGESPSELDSFEIS